MADGSTPPSPNVFSQITRALAIALSLALLARIGLAFAVFSLFKDAEYRGGIAQSLALAAQSQLDLNSPIQERSVLLSLEALEHYPYTPQAEHALGLAVANTRVHLILPSHTTRVNAAAWSPDGKHIATANYGGTDKVQIWDATDGHELLAFSNDQPYVTSVAWSPDGAHLLSANDNAKIWDAVNGKELLSLTNQASGIVYATWSPDGTQIATGYGNGTVKIWKTASGQVSRLLSSNKYYYAVTDIAWSPDGKRIIVVFENDPRVQVWDVTTSNEVFTFTGHKDLIISAGWSPDGTLVATLSGDYTVKIWRAFQTTQDLVIYAKQCCLVRELTPEERVQFNLPPK